jgi:hypothetical protein
MPCPNSLSSTAPAIQPVHLAPDCQHQTPIERDDAKTDILNSAEADVASQIRFVGWALDDLIWMPGLVVR